MELSLPGLIGAVFGLGVGVIDYGLIAMLIRRAVERKGTAAPLIRVGPTALDRVMKVVFVVNALVFAGLGYWFGSTVGG